MDGAPSGIALCLQGLDAPVQGLEVPNGSREAAPLKDADLDLGHVEPTAMLGGVMHLEAAGDPTGFGGRVHLIQAGQRVGVEVVLHQADVLSLGIDLIGQPPQLPGIVHLGALLASA